MLGSALSDSASEAASPDIVGVSAWAANIRAKVLAVAACPSNVLVTGPTGTGKEVIARAIHAGSPRAKKPFIPIDCAAATGGLFASHLFGHLKGAFTGAGYAALGCFRAAHGGTVFLDEIGELESDLQTKLLRVLQQRKVIAVGSHEEVPIDVRVIAATNRDLRHEVAAGRFREDLYYRLHVIALRTLPLRQRPGDIDPLAQHFLHKLAITHGLRAKRLSEAALEHLRQYAWPGNVRQLENVLERAAFLTNRDVIDREDIHMLEEDQEDAEVLAFGDTPTVETAPAWSGASSDGAIAPTAYSVANTPWPTMADVELEHIRKTLQLTFGNRGTTARLLAMERHQLTRKIRKYGLEATWADDPLAPNGHCAGCPQRTAQPR
jgi:DNA-binding NtrC family response regulator